MGKKLIPYIILVCLHCSGTNISKGKFTWTFHCNTCDKDLELHDVTYQEQQG